jgi:hypothetical protein
MVLCSICLPGLQLTVTKGQDLPCHMWTIRCQVARATGLVSAPGIRGRDGCCAVLPSPLPLHCPPCPRGPQGSFGGRTHPCGGTKEHQGGQVPHGQGVLVGLGPSANTSHLQERLGEWKGWRGTPALEVLHLIGGCEGCVCGDVGGGSTCCFKVYGKKD